MSNHTLTSEGRFSAAWNSEAENVTIRSEPNRMWKFIAEADDIESQFSELLETFEDATAGEIRWLWNTLQCVETWEEHCNHDLARYGEVNVSC